MDQSSPSSAGVTQKQRKAVVVRKESADTQEHESYQLKGMGVERVRTS